MPMMRVERRSGTYVAPAGGGNTNLCNLTAGERVLAIACNVRVAGNGTGTLSFGRTGAPTAYYTTGDLGAGPSAGKRYGGTGGDLTGDGVVNDSTTQVIAAYTPGTNTVHPEVEWVLLVVRDEHFKDLMVN